MNILLRAQGLVAGWQQPATRALDLAIAAGEVVGLTGPNGVGKSTVLAAIAGRATVFAGRLERAPGLRLGLQTQDVPPVVGLPISGRELLALTGATSSGLPPWLAERLDTRLDRLSGGQRHYLTLWAVLQAPADLVLLDEPTNNLDPPSRQAVADALTSWKGSIIFVSHDTEFVEQLQPTKVLLMPDGQVDYFSKDWLELVDLA
jgi:ATPase subunit of ABC transporter with duplicated ATPase domains